VRASIPSSVSFSLLAPTGLRSGALFVRLASAASASALGRPRRGRGAGDQPCLNASDLRTARSLARWSSPSPPAELTASSVAGLRQLLRYPRPGRCRIWLRIARNRSTALASAEGISSIERLRRQAAAGRGSHSWPSRERFPRA